MKIVRCGEVTAAMGDAHCALAYLTLVAKMLDGLEQKYIDAGEPALLAPSMLDGTRQADVSAHERIRHTTSGPPNALP